MVKEEEKKEDNEEEELAKGVIRQQSFQIEKVGQGRGSEVSSQGTRKVGGKISYNMPVSQGFWERMPQQP